MSERELRETLDRRRAGVLLHITSLPGNSSSGELGSEAYRFVDFLAEAGFSVWQTLPIGPTQEDDSPYQSSSMHAGNPHLISLEPLVAEGLIDSIGLGAERISNDTKSELLLHAWQSFAQRADDSQWEKLNDFISKNSYWLEDYVLFRALQETHANASWWCWPELLRDRKPEYLTQARNILGERIAYLRFEQFLFFRQWCALKQYANGKGIKLFGDMPIFVAQDSAEVWSHREMFYLDEQGLPEVVAGVPPDYFSETGQRWGNPLYRWDIMAQDQFNFWVERMRTQLFLFDLIRIDHFRGFEAYWEIPAYERHAISGRWVKAPGEALFDRLHQIYNPLPLVAEDLGLITPAVTALRMKYRLPGMKILQFAFTGDTENPYLPFRHETNSVVYTGTHDNDTTLGWYTSLNDHTRQKVDEYLGYSREAMPWPLIRTALASRARLAILPMQDILGLSTEHRMNLPGTTGGNWHWRFQWAQLDQELGQKLNRRIQMYERQI